MKVQIKGYRAMFNFFCAVPFNQIQHGRISAQFFPFLIIQRIFPQYAGHMLNGGDNAKSEQIPLLHASTQQAS